MPGSCRPRYTALQRTEVRCAARAAVFYLLELSSPRSSSVLVRLPLWMR